MNKFKTMRGMQLVAGGALLMLATLAHAQFVWVDAKGIKQYSDQPPPASVPLNKILKSPGRMATLNPVEEPAAKPADTAAPAAKTTAERELDYRKRQKAKTDAEAKAADADAHQAQTTAACSAARSRSAELATGRRLRGADNAILDDNTRAAEQAMTNQALSQCN